MKHPRHNALIRYVVLLAGLLIFAWVQVFVDVQIRDAAIDVNDATTWPNMAPGVAYYLLPFVIVPIVVVTLVADPLVGLFMGRQPARLSYWFLLGALYSLPLCFHVLRHIDVGYNTARILGISVAVLSAFAVRGLLGYSTSEDAA